MSNCIEAFRTNYFHVKSTELFDRFCAFARQCNGDFCAYKNPDGTVMVGGYGTSSLYLDSVKNLEEAEAFLRELDIEPNDDDLFFDVLQKLVTDNDAIIYKCGGHEKMRYIILSACIVTSNHIEWLDIDGTLMNMARSLLDNPEWETNLCY